MIISTTPSLEGMNILCYLNIVFGEVIVGTDFTRDLATGFTNFLADTPRNMRRSCPRPVGRP